MDSILKRVQDSFARDYTLTALRVMIIAWSLVVIVLALLIENKLLLALILAYEVLP